MDQNLHHQPKLMHRCCSHEEEVNSMEWEFISMTKQEEDLIYRMHKLVGDRWVLIAGRIPGRTAEEIERHGHFDQAVLVLQPYIFTGFRLSSRIQLNSLITIPSIQGILRVNNKKVRLSRSSKLAFCKLRKNG
ncbi:hypothetical protein K7X08_009640 [Anisodus acutangulus]|uniref:Myb-like domain-containing protein n=1 Tax=Anisodus acutangulus TaxID=402998 RepID=A0A9Q1N5Q9_9SOLA|nr:hypothetical protein K7X08_009640 [Anisodus acutangulus]